MKKIVKMAIFNTPLHRQTVVSILVISILFILVFLVFNKGQRQYALQNVKNFYLSPLVWQLSYTDRHSFIQIFFSSSPQLHHKNICAITT